MKDSFFKNFAAGISLMFIFLTWSCVCILKEDLIDLPKWISYISILLIVGPKALDKYMEWKGSNLKTNESVKEIK